MGMCVALLAMAVLPNAQAVESTDSLGAWRDYAARGVTPEFTWAARPSAAAVEPSVLDARLDTRSALMPSLSFASNAPGLSLSVRHAYASETPSAESAGFAAQELARSGTGLERTFIMPSVTRALGDSTTITGALVIAYQQFATPGLGQVSVNDTLPVGLQGGYNTGGYNESSMGSAVRIEAAERIGDNLTLHTAFQSKLDMEAFQSYRGVYADPGDFDVPAIASVGLGWSPSPRHRLGFDVQRVMYSDVNTFTSSALPTRFLSLLGDGATPDFTWRDLTVYGVDWTWQASARNAIQLRYSTQLQPEPSSELLYHALEDDFTDNNFALGFTHRFDRMGALRFAASYAPAQYFMGNYSYSDREGDGDHVELEAVWSIAF